MSKQATFLLATVLVFTLAASVQSAPTLTGDEVFKADFEDSTVESGTDAANLNAGTAGGTWDLSSALAPDVQEDSGNKVLFWDTVGDGTIVCTLDDPISIEGSTIAMDGIISRQGNTGPQKDVTFTFLSGSTEVLKVNYGSQDSNYNVGINDTYFNSDPGVEDRINGADGYGDLKGRHPMETDGLALFELTLGASDFDVEFTNDRAVSDGGPDNWTKTDFSYLNSVTTITGFTLNQDDSNGGAFDNIVITAEQVPTLGWNVASGNWIDPSGTNWTVVKGTPSQNYPNADIDAVVNNSGTADVATGDAEAQNLQLTDGTVDVNATRTLTVSTKTTVGASGTLDVSGTFDSGIVDNQGAVTVFNGGSINAETFTSSGTTDFQAGSGGTITNLIVTGGTMTAAVTVNVTDLNLGAAGTLNTSDALTAATMTLAGTLNRTGTGAQRDVTVTDTLTIDGAISLTGEGTLDVSTADVQINSGGTLTIDAKLTAAGLELNGGALAGGQDVEVANYLRLQNSSNLDMTGAALTTTGANVSIDSGSTLTLGGAMNAAELDLNGGALAGDQDVTVTSALTLRNSATLDMTGESLTTTGALVDIGEDTTLTVDEAINAATINLAGTLNRTGVGAGDKDVTVTAGLNLSADLDMTGATLTTTGADVSIGDSATLTVDNAISAKSLDIAGTLTKNGAGAARNVTVSDYLTVGSALDMTGGGALNVDGAAITLQDGGTLSIDESISPSGLVGGGTLNTNGTLTINAQDSPLEHTGQLNITGGTLTIDLPSASSTPAGATVHYAFDGDATDSIGSLDGTEQGDASYGAGKFGQAVFFDGAGDYVEVADDDALTPSEFSMSFWTKIEGGGIPISKRTADNVGGYVWAGNTMWVRIDGTWQGLNMPREGGDWSFVTVTYDGNVLKSYVNGLETGSITDPGQLNNDDAVLTFGKDSENGDDFFTGGIDQFYMYDKALTLPEVRNLYGTGVTESTLGDVTLGASSQLSITGGSGQIKVNSLATSSSPKVSGGMTVSGPVTASADAKTLTINGAVEADSFDVTGDTGDTVVTTGGVNIASGGSLSVSADAKLKTDGTQTIDAADASVNVQGALHVADGTLTVNMPNGPAELNTAPSTTDLKAHWSFDEGAGTTAADDSGLGHDGTLNGSGVGWDAGAAIGESAVSFANDGDRVDIGQAVAEIGDDNWTIAAWVKTNGYGQILSKSDGDSIWDNSEKSVGIQSGADWNTLDPEGNFYATGNANNGFAGGHDYDGGSNGSGYLDGTWHHVVLAYDAGADAGSIWIDGTSQTLTHDAFAGADNASDTMTLGWKTNAGSNTQYVGSLDDIYVYQRILSQSEIDSLRDVSYGPASLGNLTLEGGTQLTLGGTGMAKFSSVTTNGDATISGEAVMSGRVTTGSTLTIDGDMTMQTGSSYRWGNGDLVDVSGELTFQQDWELSVDSTGLVATGNPADTMTLFSTGDGVSVVYTGPVPGDVNGDSSVDTDDLGVLLQNFDQAFEGREFGDLVDDDFVDTNDLASLLQNFGGPFGTGAVWAADSELDDTDGLAVEIDGTNVILTGIKVQTTSTSQVPEPVTLALLGLGGVGVLIRRRRA